MISKYAIVCLVLSICVISNINGCPRAPSHLPHGRRARGDNGYKLIVGDNASGYIPGKTYNLLLLGARTHSRVQHFSHFTISAEASNGGRRSTEATPKRVGRFQLFGDDLTKFNENCVNTVSEADDLPKTEIQVMWVAPAAGSGCVSLSAMVYEGPRSWYADDGQLTRVICEKQQEPVNTKYECCACDEAKYSFIFEGIWSNETHPKDYPFAIWLTHFSDIVGATHETNFSFWGENHIASDAFRSLAEWGSPGLLETELRSKGPKLRSLIKAPGLWYPNVNTNTSANFRVDRKHHKVSLVSMFGPSPDWVVGISGEDLCTKDCSWKESLDFDLYPWDSGTDSGISYMSPNAETQPRERMRKITTMYPEDPRSPFYNPKMEKMTPLAKLYIRREKVITKSCGDDFVLAADESEDEDNRVECKVTDYSEWSPCSVTCGKGLRKRSRQYINEEKAKMAKCNRQLSSKEMCVASVAECSSELTDDEDEGENLARSQALINDNGEGVGVCETTRWSDWSECSASCGIGITMRTRNFVNHLGRKKCPHIVIVEKQKCMKPDCTFEQVELPDPICPTTQWSDWSPCNAECGKGVTIRTRLLLVEPEMKVNCTSRIELHQQKECTIRSECTFNSEMAKEICSLSPDAGPCRGVYNRYAFDSATRRCVMFAYGGCRGNKNNFLNEQDCMKSCKMLENQNLDITAPPRNLFTSENSELSVPVDCVMSDWSDWSQCSEKCGVVGFMESHRYVMKEARNGGQRCPKKTFKRRRCQMPEC